MATSPEKTASESGTPTNDPLIGKTIGGKYKIVERLGGGGMGVVYKARHLLLDDIVALKVLRSNLTQEEQYLKRFQHEATTACKIKHPHAITLHDFGVEEHYPYLVMEYIEGKSLKQIIAEEGTLRRDRVYRITEQIAGALSEAHDLGVIHRDLKPDNIMIASKKGGHEWAYVLDFGIAKVIQDENETNPVLTASGTVFGSPKYMAPEQALGQPTDTRADLYALGVIIYEMLTGKVPYEMRSVMEAALKYASGSPIPLSEANPEVEISDRLNSVVMRLLEKDPNERYPTAEEFLSAFREACRASETKAFGAQFTTRIEPTGLGKVLRGALALGIVLALAIAGFTVHQDKLREESQAKLLKQLQQLDELKAEKEAELAAASSLAEEKKQEAMDAMQQADTLLMEAEKAKEVAEANKLTALQSQERTRELQELQAVEEQKAEQLRLQAQEAARLAKKKSKEAERARAQAEAERARAVQAARKAAELRKRALSEPPPSADSVVENETPSAEQEPEPEPTRRRFPMQGKRR